MLRGKDVQELKELQRQGMSIQAISKLTGWDRKTIRKYMQAAGLAPEYGPRSAPPSKLDAFKPYLEQRLRAGVWNARVLLRELREHNYAGGYTILTDWLRPQHSAAQVVAVRRFETAPGKQAPSPERANESFVLFHREGYPDVFDTTTAMCQKAGFYPRVENQPNMLQTVLSMVEAEQGVSIVPACARSLRSNGVRFYRLQPDDVRVELVAAWKKANQSVVLRAFWS